VLLYISLSNYPSTYKRVWPSAFVAFEDQHGFGVKKILPTAAAMNLENEKRGSGLSNGLQSQRPHKSCRSCLDLDLNAVKRAVDKDEEGYSLIESDQMYGMKQPARHFRDAKDAGCQICALCWSVSVFFKS
jgi:hypothetical protein